MTSTSSTAAQLNQILSSEDFTVSCYLNKALSETSNADEEEDILTELALQLQVQTQACHDEIGRYMVEVSAMIPRLQADVGRIGLGLNGMKEDAMSLIGRDSASYDGKEGSSSIDLVEATDDQTDELETLSALSALSENLQAVRSILEAASSWDGTVTLMNDLLGSVQPTTTEHAASLAEAVDALTKLEYGAEALSGTPGSEDRQIAISEFRTKIEVLLKPMLLNALKLQSAGNAVRVVGPLQQCVSMYKSLNKLDALKDEYVKARPAAIHKLWFAFSPPGKAHPISEDVSMEGKPTFVEWLPTWFDSCLNLLAEEKRRSTAVFGAEESPKVTAKVLRECFRPLLSSFTARLMSSANSNSATFSLDIISTTYKATLAFLSLAHDQVLGAGLEMIVDIFSVVASPFVPIIQDLVKREVEHSYADFARLENATKKTEEIFATSSSIQKTVDHLSLLCADIFPLAKGSLARFEVFNCGCKAAATIANIDSRIGNHIAELSFAISTLSLSMTNEVNKAADKFDEQDVQGALELLKMAGLFVNDLQSFGVYTQERLRSLLAGLDASITLEREGAPDSLSTGEVGVLIARKTFREDSEVHSADLNGMCSVGPNHFHKENFPVSYQAGQKLASACRMFVFDLCYAVPRKWLASMSTLPEWTEKDDGNTDIMSSYSILPQSYITHVGEHILALVQALEPFASVESSLTLSKEAMQNMNSVAIEPWRELASLIGCVQGEDDDVIDFLMEGKSLPDFVTISDFEEDEDEDEEDMDESHRFCNEWLGVISSAVTGRILERMLKIQALSTKGRNHLVTDINYIENVFSALGVSGHPHPLLGHFSTILTLNTDDLNDVLSKRSDLGYRGKMDGALVSAEIRIAKMRNVTL
eukprot:CAMPEP_0116031828 /NCGR_PEP_ID=MMETSP0321-20121206/17788_1 /TAXON_ID=163516 /ORGANISM="Leptocylindrus danicus var. danicus, Strain B650" /LENGTH=876 /DNA_ID=CAMNT_0003507111 /DNA_START=111 /DNA_END=2741 /DNA_ORIENTATION=-